MVASIATIDDLRESLSGRSLRAEIRTVSARADELLITQRSPWLDAAATHLAAFLELPKNWDSYGARPISISTVQEVSQLLTRLWDLGLPAPQLVPTAKGGVQLEWDAKGVALELELEPGGRMLAVFDDPARTESWERELPPSDLAPVSDALRRIARAGRHG